MKVNKKQQQQDIPMSQPKQLSWSNTSLIPHNNKKRNLRNRMFPRYFAEEWHLSVSPYKNNVGNNIVVNTAHSPSSNTTSPTGTTAGNNSKVVALESTNIVFNIVTPDSICESSSQCLSSNNEAVINFSSSTMPRNQLRETYGYKHTLFHEEACEDDAKQSYKKYRVLIRNRLSWLFLLMKRRILKENNMKDSEDDKMINTSQHSGNEKPKVDWKDRLFLLKKLPFSSSSDITFNTHASESNNGITSSSYSSDFVKSKRGSFTMKPSHHSDFDYRVLAQQQSSSLSQSLNHPLPVVMEELI